MEIDPRVVRRYEVWNEERRLWRPVRGDLVRLRTWDIFDRFLPPSGRVADIGGGPGTHAAHLAELGYEVVLVDPVRRHVDQAVHRAEVSGFDVLVGDARRLALPDGSFDAVLLMGPLYHLPDPRDRRCALQECARILRPGGTLLAEAITRYAWVIDATEKGLLGEQAVWDSFDVNIRDGLSDSPDRIRDGDFWAYFHRVHELVPEIEAAGFGGVSLMGVEGFAWILGNLEELLVDPKPLLRALRLTEAEPSMLGVSPHVMAVAKRGAFLNPDGSQAECRAC